MNRSIVSYCIAGIALAVSAFSSAVSVAASSLRSVCNFFKAEAFKVLAGPVKLADATETAPRALIVAARTFAARIQKRERPVLTASWRMCPSI